jgi:hypothetical protein
LFDIFRKIKMIDKKKRAEDAVNAWLGSVVVGLNLCPFSKLPYSQGRIRIQADLCHLEEEAFESIIHEINLLAETDEQELETTLLVFPELFDDFEHYNDFLYTANEFMRLRGWEGVYQIASFHPEYQFAGTKKTDAENFTNRAPYPIFHFISEASLSSAIKAYPNVDEIPERNIALMNSLSDADLKQYFSWCFKDKK